MIFASFHQGKEGERSLGAFRTNEARRRSDSYQKPSHLH